MAAHHDILQHLRQPLLDRAREAHSARTCTNAAMKDRVLASVETTLYSVADRLWQASNVAGVDIAGDLILADRLAAAQQKWNADDRMGALDALLEAAGHMRRHIDQLNREGEAA